MSLDRRLREGFERLISDIVPDVERHLHVSHRVARRRIIMRRVAMTATSLAVLAVVVVTGPRLLEAFRTERLPAGPPSPSAAIGPETIAGTYTVTVDAGPEVVERFGLAGEWTLELNGDGSISMTAPASFDGSVEGYTFDVSGNVFVTNAFVNDVCNEAQGQGRPVGRYEWELVGGDLVLRSTDDACPGRTQIFGGMLRATE
jgi:hypothetical protein